MIANRRQHDNEILSNDREKAKELICDILKVSGGELRKKSALYKAFYFAHLFFWRDNDDTLTDYPIVRMPRGPGIDNGNELLNELESEGKILISKETCGPWEEFVYSINGNYDSEVNAPRYQAIQEALEFIQGEDATEISHDAHRISKSWQDAQDGQELNIYADLMDDEEYMKMKRGVAVSDRIFEEIF